MAYDALTRRRAAITGQADGRRSDQQRSLQQTQRGLRNERRFEIDRGHSAHGRRLDGDGRQEREPIHLQQPSIGRGSCWCGRRLRVRDEDALTTPRLADRALRRRLAAIGLRAAGVDRNHAGHPAPQADESGGGHGQSEQRRHQRRGDRSLHPPHGRIVLRKPARVNRGGGRSRRRRRRQPLAHGRSANAEATKG